MLPTDSETNARQRDGASQTRGDREFDTRTVVEGSETASGGPRILEIGMPAVRTSANSQSDGPTVFNASEGAGRGEVHLVDYLRVLHRRRWTAITAFVVVLGTVTLQTYTRTPVYEAQAQLLIETQEQRIVDFQQILDENRTNDYYQTQFRILQSRALARRTIEAEKLWDSPELVQTSRGSSLSLNPLAWPGAVLNWLRPARQQTNDEGVDRAETVAQSAIISRFLANLTVSPVRASRLVDVRYRSANPEFAARMANALSRHYIEQNLELKFLTSKEATTFLGERLTEQRKALEKSELALQRYREETGAVALPDRQNIVVQRLADLNAAVTRARTERIEKGAVYNQIEAVQNDRAALDTIPAILSNSFIQQLKAQMSDLQRQRGQMAEKLGERHPDMVKMQSAIDSTDVRIAAEVQKVVQALRKDYETALSNERALAASLEQQRSEVQDLNRSSIQYDALERDAATNRQIFEGLLQRSKESDITGELRTTNIRIVDEAEVPRRPASPNVRNNLSLGFVGGAILGLVLAFFFEYLDSRIKTPDAIKRQLGLSYLGMIPVLENQDTPGTATPNQPVAHRFGEAFRTVRTNVLFSSVDDEGSRSIVVTSTAPGEGKTVVATNLARSLAQAGQRVLLVDADMRRPKAHEQFNMSLEPGLSNVMVGESKVSEAVKKSSVQNLWVLTAGKHPPNPAELLSSRRFRELLASMESHFDWLIFDSPPVMAVTDAAVISHVVTGVIFVVGSEMIAVSAAKTALSQLHAAKAKLIGGILNRVDIERNSYYYADYYRKEYGEYYTESKPV